MMKRAWIITHDTYIDRRIFFFVDVLRAHHYDVKLFAGNYIDLLNDPDPAYVCRPVNWRLIKELHLSGSALSEEEREIISCYRMLQRYPAKCFKKAKRKYTMAWLKKGYRVTYTASDEEPLCLLRKGDLALVCNLRDNTYWRAEYPYSHCKRSIEDAIVAASAQHEEITSKEDVVVREYRDDAGKLYLRANEKGSHDEYVFDGDSAKLYWGAPIPWTRAEPEILRDPEKEYADFWRYVYDYSPILHRVDRELQKETPDLVYVADLPTLPIGLMLKKQTGCPVIMDCHEWWYKQAELWVKDNEALINQSEKYEAKLYPKCDICITVGQYLAKDMGQCYHTKFYTIYSCMSAALCCKETDRDRSIWIQYGIEPGTHIAVFQGNLTSLRNLDTLAKATAYLEEDCRLVIIGDGPYRDEFYEILEKEGNPERVVDIGWVKQTELLKFAANADLGVLPYVPMNTYFSYSTPNKLMEYYEARLPILYDSAMMEIALVVEEAHVGIGADLSNAEILGKTANRLLHDKVSLEQLRAGFKKGNNRFGFAAQKDVLEAILRDNHLIE